MTTTETWRVRKSHAIQIADLRIFGPGEVIPNFDASEPHNARLVKYGDVVKTSAPAKLTGDALKDRAAELDIDGRSGMSADQLREAIAKRESDLREAASRDTTDQEESTP